VGRSAATFGCAQDIAIRKPISHQDSLLEEGRLTLGIAVDQHEIPALEVATWLGEQKHHLKRKHMIAVQVPMKAAIVARPVGKHQRRRPHLSGLFADLGEIHQFGRKSLGHRHAFVERIRDRGEMSVDGFT
jgi:hypothetical protein